MTVSLNLQPKLLNSPLPRPRRIGLMELLGTTHCGKSDNRREWMTSPGGSLLRNGGNGHSRKNDDRKQQQFQPGKKGDRDAAGRPCICSAIKFHLQRKWTRLTGERFRDALAEPSEKEDSFRITGSNVSFVLRQLGLNGATMLEW